MRVRPPHALTTGDTTFDPVTTYRTNFQDRGVQAQTKPVPPRSNAFDKVCVLFIVVLPVLAQLCDAQTVCGVSSEIFWRLRSETLTTLANTPTLSCKMTLVME